MTETPRRVRSACPTCGFKVSATSDVVLMDEILDHYAWMYGQNDPRHAENPEHIAVRPE